MSAKSLSKDLTVGKIAPVLLKFAFPVMMANLMQTIYNMADMVIVGRFIGSEGLSSVSVGGDVMHFFMFLGMGFATAGQIMVSQYLGAGRKKDLNEVIGTLISFVSLMGIILSVIGVAFANPFVELLNAPEEARAGAVTYTACCCVGMIFVFGYNTFASILRGMGDSKHPMIFIGVASLINIILDLLFIGAFDMGVLGAALATVIGQASSFIFCFVYLYKHRDEFGFDFKLRSFRITKRPLEIMLKLGIPIAIQSSAGSISALFVGSFINTYGVAASAITGVGNKMNSIALIVANALNTSGASIIGQSFGAGKLNRVKKVFYTVFAFDLIFTTTLSILMLCFPQQIFSLFDSGAEVLSMAKIYAPVVAVSFMGFAFRSPSLALINGLGHSKINFLMGITEGIILRIGLTYLLGVLLDLGIQGFWYGSVIASYGYAVVVFPYFFSGAWRKRKSVAHE